MNDGSLHDDDIRGLLDLVAADDSLGLEDREDLRLRMIEEFHSAWGSGATRVDEGVGPRHDAVNIVELMPEPVSPGRAAAWQRRLAISAAAIVLVAIAVSALLPGSTDDEITAVAGEVRELPTASGSSSTVLERGSYSATTIGDGVVFTTPESVEMTRSEPGLIVLEPVGGNPDASLTIMTGVGSLEAVLDEYVAAGVISMVRGSAMSTDGPISEFEIRPQIAAEDLSCGDQPKCVPIGAAALPARSRALARELIGPDRTRVWALFQSDLNQDPFQREANLIAESLAFSNGR